MSISRTNPDEMEVYEISYDSWEKMNVLERTFCPLLDCCGLEIFLNQLFYIWYIIHLREVQCRIDFSESPTAFSLLISINSLETSMKRDIIMRKILFAVKQMTRRFRNYSSCIDRICFSQESYICGHAGRGRENIYRESALYALKGTL